MRDPRERLQRLAETHVIGEHGAEPDARAPGEEVESLLLVRTHLGVQSLRQVDARQSGELGETTTQRTHRIEVLARRAELLERVEARRIGLRELPERDAHLARAGLEAEIGEAARGVLERVEVGATHPAGRQLHERRTRGAQDREVLVLE